MKFVSVSDKKLDGKLLLQTTGQYLGKYLISLIFRQYQ